MRASVTISNRRVRTRTHGGVAGVSGQPLPLCRSNALIGKVKIEPKTKCAVMDSRQYNFARNHGPVRWISTQAMSAVGSVPAKFAPIRTASLELVSVCVVVPMAIHVAPLSME